MDGRPGQEVSPAGDSALIAAAATAVAAAGAISAGIGGSSVCP